MDYNGQSLANIRPTWLHGRLNRSWLDVWPAALPSLAGIVSNEHVF